MAREVSLNLGDLLNDLNRWGIDVGKVVRTSVQDIMDDWKREAIDLAPLDTSTLRRSIRYKTKKADSGVDVTGELRASAIEASPTHGRFDYAFYIHEVMGDSFRGRKPGTIGRFMDKPAEDNMSKWLQKIEKDLRDAAENRGF